MTPEPSSATTNLPDFLAHALRRDGARPFITFYDDDTGERTELSVTTFNNWVAKTSNYLRDELDVRCGSSVAIVLPLHWLTAVALGACWSLGALPLINPDDATVPDVALIGPAPLSLKGHPLPVGDEIAAVSLAPMAASFARIGVSLPDGVRDFNDEVRVHGDHFTAVEQVTRDLPALRLRDQEWTHGQLIETAQALTARFEIGAHARLMTTQALDGPDPLDAILAAFVTPLVLDGSVVMCINASPSALAERARAEHVTTWAQLPKTSGPDI